MTSRTLIKGGIVYSMDPKIGNFTLGDVLIEDEKIIAVGPDLSVEDAAIVDATNMIIMPGLIDTHRHLWQSALRQVAADWTIGQYVQMMLGEFGPQFSPEDVYIADLLGALEALDGGVTTILDWSHIVNSPEHADAAVQGLGESGIRAVYAYGAPRTPTQPWYVDDVARVRDTYFFFDKQKMTRAVARPGPGVSWLHEN